MKNFNFRNLYRKIKNTNFRIIIFLVIVIIITAVFIWFYYSKNVSKHQETTSIVKNEEPKTKNLQPEVKQFEVRIEKIGVEAPVIENVDGTNKQAYSETLESGVAHFKGTALPGEGSNIFIFGHSSTVSGKGTYAKVFARLGELEKGDQVTIFYNGKEYKYSVFEKKVVRSDDISVLEPTNNEQLTLMTCWPIGSDKKRLIVKSKII